MNDQPKVNVGQVERMFSLAAGIALAVIGLRRSWVGLMIASLGGYLVYRGATGNCRVYETLDMDSTGKTFSLDSVSDALAGPIVIDESVTINRSPAEVFLFWRNLENLPRFMDRLQSVSVLGGGHSHWVAKTPLANVPLEWDAEITDEQENRRIAWTSLPGSKVMNSGAVEFTPALEGNGTNVNVHMEFTPPGGPAGSALARVLNKIAATGIMSDMRRFKEVMESGEETAGDQTGKIKAQAYRQTMAGGEQDRTKRSRDVVTNASEDSFPASDPPNYHAGVD